MTFHVISTPDLWTMADELNKYFKEIHGCSLLIGPIQVGSGFMALIQIGKDSSK